MNYWANHSIREIFETPRHYVSYKYNGHICFRFHFSAFSILAMDELDTGPPPMEMAGLFEGDIAGIDKENKGAIKVRQVPLY